MGEKLTLSDIIGLAKTEVDVHMLGISTLDELLQECGFKTVISDYNVSKAFSDPRKYENSSLIQKWIKDNRISILGFSYRLNSDDAILTFQKLMYQLKDRRLLKSEGGPIKKICFAGLPEACDIIKNIYNITVFYGDESPLESLHILGIDPTLAPKDIIERHLYDINREEFGKEIIKKADYLSVRPLDRSSTRNFGTKKERLVDRIKEARERNLSPLIRAHAGPYQQNREEAIRKFEDWCQKLAFSGYLDILSIGTSQLSQDHFGEDWNGLKNGGGVPINSAHEFKRIYDASRPLLVRTYAGTKNIKELAKIYENTINIAWHALSLWWFSQIDGRGPNSVLNNLVEHFDTLTYVASTNKPYEPNIPHHFAFRACDDITYVVSAVLAARVAKKQGIKDLALQTMLNNPKQTSGINDLAKARATFKLVKQLEDNNFHVYLQTRAGLDYLSHNPMKAKIQLAAVTALMDDICPYDNNNPDIIHVVSYSEGFHLATPEIIDESIQITRHSLRKYRELKRKGLMYDISKDVELNNRTNYLVNSAGDVLSVISKYILDPYSPRGLYDIFKAGFLPVPQLMYRRDEFPEAIRWKTKIRNGMVDIYDDGKTISTKDRMHYIIEEVLRK